MVCVCVCTLTAIYKFQISTPIQHLLSDSAEHLLDRRRTNCVLMQRYRKNL